MGEGRPEGAKRPTAGNAPREFTSRGEGGRVPPFFEKLRLSWLLIWKNFCAPSTTWRPPFLKSYHFALCPIFTTCTGQAIVNAQINKIFLDVLNPGSWKSA